MHTEEYYRDLMNAEIDGVITDEEAAILAERLRTDPGARQYYEELRRTVRLLDGAAEVSPPPELRGRILGAVGSGEAPGAPRTSRAGTRSWQPARYIPAFAAGMAAGMLLFAAAVHHGGSPVPAERSGGTIGAGTTTAQAVSDSTTEFEGNGVNGSVAASSDSAGTTIILRVTSQTEATALLEYGAGFAFEGISSPDGTPFQMEVEAGSLLIIHQGTAEYRVRLRSTGTALEPVDLKVFTAGAVVAHIPVATR